MSCRSYGECPEPEEADCLGCGEVNYVTDLREGFCKCCFSGQCPVGGHLTSVVRFVELRS